ncbi:hypothetical protein F2P81_003460 [Scophthalmus maximus]|uniref:Saposin B-type domain-containing protein n=1 Tax=Scophthalmus maximus TaxID=52904 RepID=A0A6A4TQL3_SCOMX|nr:hypothetical protein F2P81_003460 [Scophthalmus maximus]
MQFSRVPAAPEKIGQQLDKACDKLKFKIIRNACKMLVKKIKNKLIDAIANHGEPRALCVKLKLQEKAHGSIDEK